MIYELKKYVPHPGKSAALKARFQALTLPIFERLGIRVLYCFENPAEPEALYYMTAFDDEAARDAAWKAMSTDAQWKEGKAASEADGPLLMTQTSTDLRTTPYSPTDPS
jgi:hypothetical protein